ncbi:hypothetical protein Avbf_01717 [Armadillidium vulgare]|nr:hypothetical protein Avbf_01717 [Armadillidium vulgare]
MEWHQWSQEDSIELIEEYKKFEILWDPKHNLHYNKIKRQEAWEQVAGTINRSAEECKKKMEYLLSALRREKMKMRKSNVAGKEPSEGYKSAWFAFPRLSFILDKNKQNETLNSIKNERKSRRSKETTTTSQGNKEKPGLTSQVQMEKTSVPTFQTPKETTENIVPTPVRKRRKLEEVRLDKPLQITTGSISPIRNDECQHFGNFIASKLRNYDDITRCAIQSEIMAIFVKANNGIYNHYHSTSHLNNSDHIHQLKTLFLQQNINSPQTSASSHYSPYESNVPSPCDELIPSVSISDEDVEEGLKLQ